MHPLYLDHNATTPVYTEVLQAMLPYLIEGFGNPSSGHAFGLKAKVAVEDARTQVASLLGADRSEIVFTSCATEANNMVVQGVMAPQGCAEGHMITTAIEHPAILEPAKEMERRGARLTVVPVSLDGEVDGSDVRNALADDTRLLSIMLANNETGVLQRVWEYADDAKARGFLLHTDASQAVGKIPVDVGAFRVDLLTLAGHKLGAPKGVGALYVRNGITLPPLMFGGGQERGRRHGTENVPYIVGLGAACALAEQGMVEEMARQRRLVDLLHDGIQRLGHPHLIFSQAIDRLPNTSMIGFQNLKAGDLVEAFALADVAVSAGAACHGASTDGPLSHVLEAMGAPREYGMGAVRFSFGRSTTEDDVLECIARLGPILARLDESRE